MAPLGFATLALHDIPCTSLYLCMPISAASFSLNILEMRSPWSFYLNGSLAFVPKTFFFYCTSGFTFVGAIYGFYSIIVYFCTYTGAFYYSVFLFLFFKKPSILYTFYFFFNESLFFKFSKCDFQYFNVPIIEKAGF